MAVMFRCSNKFDVCADPAGIPNVHTYLCLANSPSVPRGAVTGERVHVVLAETPVLTGCASALVDVPLTKRAFVPSTAQTRIAVFLINTLPLVLAGGA